MAQTQIMSAAVATELLQSVGVELSIFAVTVALALVIRGVPAGKATCASQFSNAPGSKIMQPESKAAGRSSNAVSKKPAKMSPRSQASVGTTSALAQKIDSMITYANRRQAADSVNAIAMYDEMRANNEHAGIKDTSRPEAAYGLLVQCAVRVSRPELVEIFVDDMKQAGIGRSLGFYEAAMKGLASKKYYREALSVCSELEADGLEPSPVTLSCLINFASEVGEFDRAVEFFKRLSSTSTPSIRAYMTMLRVHSRRPDWAQSVALIRDMQHKEVPVDTLVLNIVLATGVAAGHLDSAKALLKEFSEKNIPDVVSYNTVMKGFAQQKEARGAMNLLDEMRRAGVKPNAITFNTAMDAAVRSSRIDEAWRVLAQMCESGLSPDKFTCTTLMKGLQTGATSEQLSIILDLLRSVTAECDSSLCSFLFRSVIEATARVNDPTLTARAVAQMREQQVMLAPQEYQRLLKVLLKTSETEKVVKPSRLVCQA